MREGEVLGNAETVTGAVEVVKAIEIALWEHAGRPALFKQKVKWRACVGFMIMWDCITTKAAGEVGL